MIRKSLNNIKNFDSWEYCRKIIFFAHNTKLSGEKVGWRRKNKGFRDFSFHHILKFVWAKSTANIKKIDGD